MRARWRIVGAIGAGALLGVLIAKIFVPSQYVSETSLVWEPVALHADAAAPDARELRTLVDSVKLPTNLAEVRRRLHIADTLENLGANIEVSSEDESNLVVIRATADASQDAARLASTVVDVFLQHRQTVERQRREEYARSLASDVSRANQRLASARADYDRFRRDNGVTDLTIERQQAIEMAARLRSQAEMASAEVVVEDARARKLREVARTQPNTTVLSRTERSPDERQLVEAQTKLASSRAYLSDDHPQVQSLRAQIDLLQRRVQSGDTEVIAHKTVGVNPALRTIQGKVLTAEATREAARERQSTYESLAAQAQARLAGLSAVEGRASQLLAAVRVAEAHVGELEGMRTRAAVSAQSAATDFRVVAEATPPEMPKSSLAKRIVAIALPIAALLGAIGLVLFRSLRGLRVYTAAEVGYWGRAPVVGSSTWPRDPEGLSEFLEELDDFAPQATGRTLIVGSTEATRDLAGKIAERLTEWPETSLFGEDPTGRVDAPPPDGRPIRAQSTALARKTAELATRTGTDPALVQRVAEILDGLAVADRDRAVFEAWNGPASGPALRRAARLAQRVLVIVPSGMLSVAQIARIKTLLGRDDGIGFAVVGLEPDLARLPDRAGSVEDFWQTDKAA